VLNVAVAKVSLKRSGIVSSICERIAAGVPEHLRVSLEPELGLGACTLDHAGETGGSKWRAPF